MLHLFNEKNEAHCLSHKTVLNFVAILKIIFQHQSKMIKIIDQILESVFPSGSYSFLPDRTITNFNTWPIMSLIAVRKPRVLRLTV